MLALNSSLLRKTTCGLVQPGVLGAQEMGRKTVPLIFDQDLVPGN